MRGLVLQSQGRLTQAVAAYSDALHLDPHRASARAARAQLYFDAGELTLAMSDADVLARDFPHSQVPWVLRARTAQRLGRADMAQRAWKEASRRAPSQIRPLNPEND